MNAENADLLAIRQAGRDRDAVQADIDRRGATRAGLDTKIAEVEAELSTLDARRAEEDTKRLVAGEDLQDPSPDEVEVRRRLERNRLGLEGAKDVIDAQTERLIGDLAEREVNLNDAFLTWAGAERHDRAAAITSALEKVADSIAQLRAVDVLQESLLPSPFRFTEPNSDWALTSGRWLTDKLASLPAELRPERLSSDRLEEAAQQRAAELLAAIEQEEK